MLTPKELLPVDSANVFFRCVEDCGEAIMITDVAGSLLYVNPAWCRIYGYSSAEALGQTPRILHSGVQDSEFYRRMWQAILDPKSSGWKGEIINRARDGALIPVLLTITPLRDLEGLIAGHMGIALDMRAQKELEATVLQQDRLASIGVLASGLAHEVGTPLGVVRGRAEYLMMQPEMKRSPNLSAGLQTIITQIDRITKLIASLLRFSRATDDVRTQDLELMAVVNEVVNLLGQNFRAASIDLRLEIEPETRVRADFNRLQQILLNLMVNAMHAIQSARRDGGGVAREHYVLIKAEPRDTPQGRRLAVSVEDTGTGIDPANMRRIFQPFFTTKDIGEGTGLGLAIVSKLVHEMKGEVTVESAFGEGAKFTVLMKPVA